MPHSRFYLAERFTQNSEVFLTGDEAHHLQRSMRKQKGEIIELVNGKHQLAKGQIVFFEKKGVCIRIQDVKEKLPDQNIILCQALPRLNRLDIIVEKGTELGMGELWLFPGDLSEKKQLSPSQLQRLENISIAALKQCGRLDLPKIILKSPLSDWQTQEYPCYYGDISEKAPPFGSLYQKEPNLLFFIGPESGFSAAEEAHLHRLQATGVKLHPYILRTDTAPLVALSQIFIV